MLPLEETDMLSLMLLDLHIRFVTVPTSRMSGINEFNIVKEVTKYDWRQLLGQTNSE